MEIERFRDFDGIQIRALNKKDKGLFRHCAGDDSVSSRKTRAVEELLFIHGVSVITTINHSSI